MAQAENPEYAARKAAQTISAAMQQNPGVSWGQAAAMAQRPADQTSYAQAVNSGISKLGGQTGGNATIGAEGGRTPGTGVGGGGVDLNAIAPKPKPSTTTEQGPAGAPTVANMGVTGQATGITNTGGTGPASATMAPPIPGADPANFHGYDLSAIPKDQLGNAENAIQKYIEDPGYAASLNQRITQNFGYEGNWITKIPELQGILIWASTSLDPATAAGQLEFAGAIRGTKWYQTDRPEPASLGPGRQHGPRRGQQRNICGGTGKGHRHRQPDRRPAQQEPAPPDRRDVRGELL